MYDGINGPDQTTYQVRIFTDDQGNLHEWIVPSKPVDQLTLKQRLGMYSICSWRTLTQYSDFNPDPFVIAILNNYIDLLTKPAYLPFIDFGTVAITVCIHSRFFSIVNIYASDALVGAGAFCYRIIG